MLSYNREGKKIQRRLSRFSYTIIVYIPSSYTIVLLIYCIYIHCALIFPDKIIDNLTLRVFRLHSVLQ